MTLSATQLTGFYAHAQAATNDPNFASVAVLCHFNGTDASTTFTDDGPTGHTLTAQDDAQIDTAQSQFGGASGLFDGTGDFVVGPDHADFKFGSGDFTVECWARFVSIAAAQTFCSKFETDSDLRGWQFDWVQSTTVLRFRYTTDGTAGTFVTISGTFSPSTDTWYHLAASKVNGNINLFVDGSRIAQTADSGTIFDAAGAEFRIGCTLGTAAVVTAPMNGHLDDLRITKGVGRYEENFAPPASAHPNE